MDLARYLIFASLAFTLLWIVFRERMRRRKIQPRTAPRRQLQREFLWSLSSVGIYGLIGTGSIFLIQSGWSKMYFDVAAHDWGLGGWGYAVFSVLAIIVLHDA